ncbi:hypothetical protein C8R44DRAFT_984222 [Mycena epipterygia]|nr:hypothetical protein C8R44DRAFT_984222 [Mycena epipterygia]
MEIPDLRVLQTRLTGLRLIPTCAPNVSSIEDLRRLARRLHASHRLRYLLRDLHTSNATPNQYADLGLQDFQHPQGQNAPDLQTMFSALHLRQDHLEHQNRMLLQTNATLQARLASIESNQMVQPASSASRGTRAPSRGGKKRAPSVHTVIDEALLEGPSSVPDLCPAGSDLPSLGDADSLSPEQKKARQNLQRYVSKTFRTVCGVGVKDQWPDPDIQRINEVTGELYLTPYFESGVADACNMHIFAAVAKQVANEFQDKTCWPQGLATCGATWDSDVLKSMAKASFPNFKRQWNTDRDEAAKARKDKNDRTNRVRGRRFQKAQQRQLAAPKYAVEHNLDPDVVKDVMHEEHMSDEVSGPEDEEEESFPNWKRRMAIASGYGDLPPAVLAKMNFVEVLEPDWRSMSFSSLNKGRARRTLSS